LNIYYYRKGNGREPVRDFIDFLPVQDRARIFFDLNLLRQRGINECGISLRHIDGKLWEIRFRLSAGYRIFYCFFESDIYLLHAYKKQSQKAPEHEIETAFRRMKDLT
jgi:phage-related protein